jgi:hypothetical protein
MSSTNYIRPNQPQPVFSFRGARLIEPVDSVHHLRSNWWGVIKPIVGSNARVPFGNSDVKSPPPRPNSIVGHRERFEAFCPVGVLVLELLNDYEVPDKKYMQLDPAEDGFEPWVPTHARIDWATENEKVPVVLMLPDRWRKEFGGRWGWDPATWAPRYEWLPGKWAPLKWLQATDPKGLLALLAPLPTQGLKIITDWVMPWQAVVERGRAADRRLQEWLRIPVRFSEWLRVQLGEPVKGRPVTFSVMSRSLRVRGNEVTKGANAGLDADALDERAMSFMWLSAFVSKRAMKSFIMNRSSEQLGRDLDRLDKALAILIPQAAPIDPSIYETTQTISTGIFTSPSTSSAVTHSTRWLGDPPADAAIAEYESWKRKPKPEKWKWADWSNRRKQLWGCNDSAPDDDFHDRTMNQAQSLPAEEKRREYDLTFCISEERDVELQTKFETHAADLEVQRRKHVERVNAEVKNPIEFSEALTDEWNARLAEIAAEAESAFTSDRKLGLEHTGLENLGNKELRSLKYRKSHAIPRYKNELAADLDNEADDEAEELPDEDAVPDEDEVVSDVEEVEPEDDDLDEGNEDSEIFSEPESETSEGTSYSNDPRFSDDDAAAGPPEGHHHLVPDYEDNLRKTREERQYTHEELQYVRRHADRVKKDPARRHISPVVIEMIVHNRTPEEALDICGVDAKPKTAQKWKERFVEEAEMLKDRPNGIPDVEMTDEMFDDIKEGAAYVLVDLDNGWKYHKLETETYATLDAAVQALKEDKIRAAWKECDVRKKTQKGFIKYKEVRRLEMEKIREKFDQRFKGSYVARDPNQWPKSTNYRGLLGDLVDMEG